MRDLDHIYAVVEQRRRELGPVIQQMRSVSQHYHDDIVMPLPEIDRNEDYAVPNLVAQGIDQFAMRVSSILPDMTWPAQRPNIAASVKKATDRRKAAFGWWEHSHMPLALRQAARWLAAYGQSPWIVEPDHTAGVPTYTPRNPALTLPAPKLNAYDVAVDDVAFTYTRTHKWLRLNYGYRFPATQSMGARNWLSDDTPIEVIEWHDADDCVLMAVGPATNRNWQEPYAGVGNKVISLVGPTGKPRATAILLTTYPNRIDMCPVSVPGRFGLERITGMMDSVLGMRVMQARLMALEANAVERAIYPNEWAVFNETGQGQVVKLADGRKGIVGEVRGGQVTVTNVTPGVQTMPLINVLERNQRITGGIPSDFGGEGATNVRTGRRGDQLLSAVIDFPIAENQQLLASGLQHADEIAVAVAKAHFGPRLVSMHISGVGAKNAKGHVSYTAADTFETDEHTVAYPMAGTDSNSIAVSVGQMVGASLMSADTGRRLLPTIDDPDEEARKVVVESLDRALLASLEQGAASGQLPVDDLAFITEQFIKGNVQHTYEAVQAAQRRAQERQASTGPVGAPDGPAIPGSPEAQAGLAAGTPAEAAAVPPTIEGIPEGQSNQVELLRALGTVRRAGNAA